MASRDLLANAVGHYEDLVAKGLPGEYAISAASLPGEALEVILDRARDRAHPGQHMHVDGWPGSRCWL